MNYARPSVRALPKPYFGNSDLRDMPSLEGNAKSTPTNKKRPHPTGAAPNLKKQLWP